MTLSYFKSMDLKTQRWFCRHGVFLDRREENEYYVLLSRLGEFYVEAYYRLNDDELMKIIAFDDRDSLMPYLDKITLN